MADTSVLDPFSTKPRETVKVNQRDQLGGSMEYVEELLGGTIDLILKGPQGSFVNEGPVTGASLEELSQMPEFKPDKFSSGTIEFNKKPDLDPQLAITEAQRIVQESQHARSEFLMDEEIRFEAAGMSTEDRNERLHVNASFARPNTETAYHRAAIYARLKMELREAQQRERDTQIPSPAKQAYALETQFEGGSGKMGSGTASLSSASGAVG